MSTSIADKVFPGIGLAGFGGLLVCVAIGLYYAYFKIDLLLRHLGNSPAVTMRASMLNAGPAGRLFVLSAVLGVLTAPKMYLKDGGASIEDLRNFPAALKKKLVLLHRFSLASLAIVLGIFVVVQLGYF